MEIRPAPDCGTRFATTNCSSSRRVPEWHPGILPVQLWTSLAPRLHFGAWCRLLPLPNGPAAISLNFVMR
jgi:hypothetical protein